MDENLSTDFFPKYEYTHAETQDKETATASMMCIVCKGCYM